MKKRYAPMQSAQFLTANDRLAAGSSIKLDGLASGFYLLHANNQDGTVFTYKFTIK